MRGIIRSRAGYRAFVKVGNIQRERRFPIDTPIKTMQNWREETRVALRKLKTQPAAVGSL